LSESWESVYELVSKSGRALGPVISVTEVNLARGTEGPSRARSRGVVASKGRVKAVVA